MHLDELLFSIHGFIVPTVRVGENLRGSDRYPVNEPRRSEGMWFNHHPSYDSGEYTERIKRKYKNCKRVVKHFDARDGG